MKMIKWIWAKLTGGELVWLKDDDGKVTLSVAHIDPWGHLMARRYWPLNIRLVRLLDDGTVRGNFSVQYWKPYRG